jgi:hypothetical protein
MYIRPAYFLLKKRTPAIPNDRVNNLEKFLAILRRYFAIIAG